MLKDVKSGDMVQSTKLQKTIKNYQSNTICPVFEDSMYILYDGRQILLCDKLFRNTKAYNYEKNIFDACTIEDSVYVSTI